MEVKAKAGIARIDWMALPATARVFEPEEPMWLYGEHVFEPLGPPRPARARRVRSGLHRSRPGPPRSDWGSEGRRFNSYHPDHTLRGFTTNVVNPFFITTARLQ